MELTLTQVEMACAAINTLLDEDPSDLAGAFKIIEMLGENIEKPCAS